MVARCLGGEAKWEVLAILRAGEMLRRPEKVRGGRRIMYGPRLVNGGEKLTW